MNLPIPRDDGAEAAVLGACMVAPVMLDEVALVVTPEDFYKPIHGWIYEAMLRLRADGKPAEPSLLARELIGREHPGGHNWHALVFEILGNAPAPTSATYHADIVAEMATKRRLVEAGTRIAQRASSGAAADDVLAEAAHEIEQVRASQPQDGWDFADVHELLARDLTQTWVLPGLMAEGDRLVLTGVEGFGKSTLVRQLLAFAAAGVNPFSLEEQEPVLAAALDVENGEFESQRHYANLVGHLNRINRPVGNRLKIRLMTRLDLLDPIEQRTVLRAVERLQPQLLYVGPVYNLHNVDENDNSANRKLTDVFNRMREATGCALITEHHMAKAPAGHLRSTTPVGASVWMRWPEFGFGLMPHEDADESNRLMRLKPFRGARSERAWPRLIVQGRDRGVPWPWVLPDTYAMAEYASEPVQPEPEPIPEPSQPEELF